MDASVRSLSLALLFAVAAIHYAQAQGRVICYYSSWAVYRPTDGRFTISDLDPFLCNHLIYAFIGLQPDGQIRIMDQYNDIDLGGYTNFNALRQVNPELKTLVAIGGWYEESKNFSIVCRDPALRATFVNNLFGFVQQWGFSGADIDWEYPTDRGGAPEDKENFSLLIEELKALFAPAGLLLGAAVSANVHNAPNYYDIPRIAASLDFINLMTYDYHGPWDPVTGFNAPLYAGPADPDPTFNVDASVQMWLSYGIDRSKVVMGTATYGRTFTLADPGNTGVGAPAVGAGVGGPWTNEPGSFSYMEVCTRQLWEGGWGLEWYDPAKSAYTFKGDQWIGYDYIPAIQEKGRYARNQGLGGVLVYAIDFDDFRGFCNEGVNPIITNLKSAFFNG
ncbi:chitotriosidase-1-like [Cloeon dipterum]|uniref:chitotriosidase-1-like n=1 Tax=Cloeon dipterum TaxID=197152 RepID=UPI0032203D40